MLLGLADELAGDSTGPGALSLRAEESTFDPHVASTTIITTDGPSAVRTVERSLPCAFANPL